MLRQLLRAALTGIVLLILAGLSVFFAIAWQINRTGARDQAQPGDAIVVLGACVEPDGQPGPDLRSRTMHGIRLFQRGLAPYLICTEDYRDDRL